MCGLTGLLEGVLQREGLRRDGACEHGVMQQRAAGEALLHEPPHVCLLMHVGAAQANSRLYQERTVRPFVSTVEQVRVGCLRRGMSCPLTQSSLWSYFGGGLCRQREAYGAC